MCAGIPSSTVNKSRGMQRLLTLLILLSVSALSGCSLIPRGLLYSDYKEPLCHDARGTTLGETIDPGSTKSVQIPLTQINLGAEWDTRAIGDIAKKHGIATVYGCDMRREFYLLGIWRRDEVIVYGN